jgi:hypothetical protein
MINIDPQKVAEWVGLAKTGTSLLRSAWQALPKGKDKDQIEHTLAAAESALHRSDAKLAQELDYHLCRCTFPPSIMLWKEGLKAHVCPNPDCGRRDFLPKAVPYSSSRRMKREPRA